MQAAANAVASLDACSSKSVNQNSTSNCLAFAGREVSLTQLQRGQQQ